MFRLVARTIDSGQVAVTRIREVLLAITQASVAAGIARYIAHDLLGHPDPFFAPIAAVVCLSASNVFHTQRAVQIIGGVGLGIILGATVQRLLGTESIAIAVAVLVVPYGEIGRPARRNHRRRSGDRPGYRRGADSGRCPDCAR